MKNIKEIIHITLDTYKNDHYDDKVAVLYKGVKVNINTAEQFMALRVAIKRKHILHTEIYLEETNKDGDSHILKFNEKAQLNGRLWTNRFNICDEMLLRVL